MTAVLTLLSQFNLLSEKEWSDLYGIELTDSPQVFKVLSRAAYDSLPGINQSILRLLFEHTPAHAQIALIKENEEEKRKDFLIGNIAHCAALEEDIYQRYIVIPDDAPSRPTEKQLELPSTQNKQSVAYKKYEDALKRKEWWDNFDQKCTAKELVNKKDLSYGILLADALKSHPVIGSYLTSDQRFGNEITLTYIDPITKLRIKARLDMLRILCGVKMWIGDIKTTHDAAPGPDHFGKSAVNNGYIFQAAYYTDAVYRCAKAIEEAFGLIGGISLYNNIEYEWICIEKVSRPHYTFISRQLCPDECIELGRQQYRKALNQLHVSMLSGYFAGYSTEAVPLQIPIWGYRKLAESVEDDS